MGLYSGGLRIFASEIQGAYFFLGGGGWGGLLSEFYGSQLSIHQSSNMTPRLSIHVYLVIVEETGYESL